MPNLLKEVEVIEGVTNYLLTMYDESAHLKIGTLNNLTTETKTDLVNAINEVLTKIGTLANLSTEDKTSIVNAINEVLTKIGTLANLSSEDKTSIVNAINEVLTKIGTLANLSTEDKTSIVNAINEVYEKLANNINVLTYINGVKAGITPNDQTKAHENVTILNTLLSQGKTVYLPTGNYYIDDVINLVDGSGIFARNSDKCMFIATNSNGCIKVPVVYDPQKPYKVETCVRLENIRLYNPNGGGTGLTLYNYTYEVTCHNSGAEYLAYKGNSYGLEYRNSIFRNIQITGYDTGLRCGVGTGVFNLNEFYIDTCGAGLIDNSADSTFNEFNITFCTTVGVSAGTTIANKYNNFKVYMNEGNGVTLYNCRNTMISNMNCEENKNIGAQLINCSGCTVDIISASNGFNNSTGTDYDKVGVAMTGCTNICGKIIALDKNAAYFGGTASQTYGLTIDSPNTGSIIYEDFSNKYSYNELTDNTKANTIIGGDISNTSFASGANCTINTNYVNYCQYSNNMMSISCTITTSDAIPYDSIVAQCIYSLPSKRKTYNNINHSSFFLGRDSNTGTVYSFKIVDGSIHANEALPSGANIILNHVFPYSFK